MRQILTLRGSEKPAIVHQLKPQMADDADRLLTSGQLADLRQCSLSKVEKERLAGVGPPFIKDGFSVRYRLGDYRSWIASRQRFRSTAEVGVV